MRTRLDHIVIAATDMERGVAWTEKTLGVRVPRGGVHETMGTRNHVMRIGEEMFLEIIAINPDGPVPAKPRWFGLDDPSVRARLDRSPAFLAWVANTDDLDAFLDAAPMSFGRATPVSRGELNWRFALPSDGRLLAGGMLPYAIQWRTESHPALAMPDLGCRLLGLDIYHPYPEWLGSVLNAVGPVDLVQVHPLPPLEPPRMAARIDTPEGVRLLETMPGGCGCPPRRA
ncbi:VOC family protein [Pseudodesulfovibrio karagichevae]|uniref:VOC family protein n=1 Tax=Pseudodesulfovibrio karagichevae TaxID=3239305 RepID=A0ABV4K7V3_9BACT